MKKIYFLAALATMFAACSSNDKLDTGQDPQQPVASAEVPVGFDAYYQRATTRAGKSGDIDLTELKKNKELGGGFGVFAYYTDNNEYDPQRIPNFMYNQGVFWNGAAGTGTSDIWEYEPIKYWPNEYGGSAISDDNDKVSYFAYAPYVDVVPSTGKLNTASPSNDAKWGITGMSRNSATGDPLIKYMVSFDKDKMVDLLWGVCDDTQWKIINNNLQTINEGVKGLPWLNVERPLEAATQVAALSSKLKFQFKHALSQLNVQIDTYTDGDAAADVDTKSKVYVRSISFTGFATQGCLNLNNTEPNKALWLDYSGTADLNTGEEVTIFDGRKDGKEGASGSVATNEKLLGFNPDLIQTTLWGDAAQEPGVTGTAQNLFRQWDDVNNKYIAMAAGDPVYVIPTGDEMTVTIVYDIETEDSNLATYVSDAKTFGSSIENRITKSVSFGKGGMENGKKYVLKLHLGMNSVKFDADVTDWDDNTNENEIDLPANTPKYSATSGAEYGYTVDASGTTYNIALTGFYGGESITPTNDATVATANTGDVADAKGVVYPASITIAANNTVKNIVTGWVKWDGNASGKQVKLNIIQLAHVLGLANSAVAATDTEIVLTSTANDIDWTADVNTADIAVVKNGTPMTYNATPGAGQFGWDATNHKITLNAGEAIASGDIFVITVKAGDAPAETITVSIP